MTDTIRGAVAEREARVPGTAAETGALALRGDQAWWTPRQLGALRSLGLEKCPDGDLMVFFHYCQKTGLDPFSKQIYLIERKAKRGDAFVTTWVIQVAIDGLRVNAQRAADRRGIFLEYEDTVWFDQAGGRHEVWLDTANPPSAARVVVVKVMSDGTRLRVPALVTFESYASYGVNHKTGERWLQGLWKTMGDHQIEKCAEAFALRRAFPNDLGGLYVEEELQGSSRPPVLPSRESGPPEEAVVPGEVEGVPAPEESQARLAEAFRARGLGAKAFARLRLAVVTGLMAGDDDVTGYIDVKALTPDALAAVVETACRYLDGLTDTDEKDVTAQVREYGESVIDRIAAATVVETG